MSGAFVMDPMLILAIIGAATLSTSLCELIMWVFVYRKEDYNLMKSIYGINIDEIEKLNKKVQKKRNVHVIQAQNKGHEKKLSQVESQLKALNQQMTMKNMKWNLAVGLFMIVFINYLGGAFQGLVVAKLPFVPFSLIQGITHRNIAGQDFTDCSYLFIYILSAFLIRTNIKKLFGFQPPTSAVSFFEPPKAQ